MAYFIVLDSGPLGLACGRPERSDVGEFQLWRREARSWGATIVIPEIADYEVRRELVRSRAASSVKRLDALRREERYLPISTAAMRKAADLWADARNRGVPTADDKALDGDAIIAAQALRFVGLSDRLVVATENEKRLSRFGVEALGWKETSP